MISKNIGENLLTNIVFKTQAHHKNYDFVVRHENIMTEYQGTITKLRIPEQKPPVIIGEYSLTVLNMTTARLFEADIYELIKDYSIEDVYKELLYAFKNDLLDPEGLRKDAGKVVLLHSYVLHPDYRNQGVTEELIEMLHREFYTTDNVIIALVKPFQENMVDADYLLNKRVVEVRDTLHGESRYVTALDYYSFADFLKETDTEMIEYKLFAIANRCGFNRLGDSHLFMYTPDKTIERMLSNQHVKQIL